MEENPFEDEQIAKEWINSVENEKGLSRDTAIYPYLQKWAGKIIEGDIIEIGSGQGICSEKLNSPLKYVGIEPSIVLVDRAKEKYSASNRNFVVGDAYKLPVPDTSAAGIFSVNVWFHLENPILASKEIFRVLKEKGTFLIITVNPDAYDIWENFYENPIREGKKLTGKVEVPINPLSKNIFYAHSFEETMDALHKAGLTVNSVIKIGQTFKDTGKTLFVAIEGVK